MCGIAGIVRRTGISPDDRSALPRMLQALAERGPDDRGALESDGRAPGALLGQTRLSILDLSPAGHQPMSDESGRWSITFNGEIFNFRELRPVLERRGHVLRSRTDTEVLLKLFIEFGPACLPMLSGMFAFAIWDEAERRLFIARDRIGKKPLFYYASRELFVLASEPKSLFRHPDVPRRLRHEKIAEYLCLRYVCAPDTLYEGISRYPSLALGGARRRPAAARAVLVASAHPGRAVADGPRDRRRGAEPTSRCGAVAHDRRRSRRRVPERRAGFEHGDGADGA